MDAEVIRILLEAIRAGSFSKAAQSHCYTPSALSHAADKLENELSITLFNRNSKGISLTDDGQHMLPYLMEFVEAQAKMRHAALTLSAKNGNTLKIGCYSSIAKSLLPPVLSKLNKALPNLTVSVVVGDITENLLSVEKADVVFAEKCALPNTLFTPLCKDPYVAVVRQEDFSNKATLTRDDFFKKPFIMPNDLLVRNYFDSLPITVIQVFSDDNDSVISMVRQGLGITLLPKLSVVDLPSELKTVPLDTRVERTLGLIYRADSSADAVHALLSYLPDFSQLTVG